MLAPVQEPEEIGTNPPAPQCNATSERSQGWKGGMAGERAPISILKTRVKPGAGQDLMRQYTAAVPGCQAPAQVCEGGGFYYC